MSGGFALGQGAVSTDVPRRGEECHLGGLGQVRLGKLRQ